MSQEKFRFASLGDVRQKAQELGVRLPLSEDLSVLARPLRIGARDIPNRIAIQPMEGCDGARDGSPAELTRRRYRRFAASGAGLIWAEAVAVVPEGRANPRQLMLTAQNLDAFKAMADEIKEIALRESGFEPYLVLQATHSGRYSKPDGAAAPRILYHSPIFEKDRPLDDACLVSDDYLRALPDAYAETARLSEAAGFDAVDIKACHRYLLNESLSAFTRGGPYGGSFDNRTRLVLDCARAARAAVSPRTDITSRLNIYDSFAYPYGFGTVHEEGRDTPDMDEAAALVALLQREAGLSLVDFTLGNPYFNPHINRPFDTGPYEAPEHPLCGVARAADLIARVRAKLTGVAVISSALSYLRQYSPQLAAGLIESGACELAGFGRMAFAYPEFARDLLQKGELDKARCCITCCKCSELMRAGSTAGCVVRDNEVYGPIYRRDVLESEHDIRHMVSNV